MPEHDLRLHVIEDLLDVHGIHIAVDEADSGAVALHPLVQSHLRQAVVRQHCDALIGLDAARGKKMADAIGDGRKLCVIHRVAGLGADRIDLVAALNGMAGNDLVYALIRNTGLHIAIFLSFKI